MQITRRHALMGASAILGAAMLGTGTGLSAETREKARALGLRITALKTFLVAPRSIFVKVYTNQGITGLGVALQTSKEVATAAAIMENERVLIGRDPTRIEALWQELYQAPRWRGGPLTAAISAIDIALWDILGQALGQPIHQLLGGAVRDSIRIYGSTMDMTPAIFAEQKAQGITATRVQAPKGSVGAMIAATRRWREMVGPDHELAVHMDGTLSTREAMQYLHRVEDLNLLWVEEPIQMDDVEDWAMLRARTTTPLATGERVLTKWGFAPYLNRHLIDFAQPDIASCGGLSEARKIAALAEVNRIQMAPHGPHESAGALVNLHFDAATPNFFAQEVRDYTSQFELDLHEGLVPQIKDGFAALPDRPGLGTVLNEKIAAQRPYIAITRSAEGRAF
ncbi:enolase C-terminal domain-like protein [Novosphingobium sp.]|uniref:enolase C-terminal domain-like protein n=1 Tax=Novosphingobium sp. TaxID=1874826 RepID=UPI0035ADCC43